MDSPADLTDLLQVLSGASVDNLSPEVRMDLLLSGIVARLEADASPTAVHALLSAVVQPGANPVAREGALLALRRLAAEGSPFARDAVYTLAVEYDLPAARQWIDTQGWQPTLASLRTLFDWFTGQGPITSVDGLQAFTLAYHETNSVALRTRLLGSAAVRGMENWALIVSAHTSAQIDQLVARYPAFNEDERQLARDHLLALAVAPAEAANQTIPDAARALPLLFVLYEDRPALQLARQHGFLPADTRQQAVYLFLAEDWAAYTTLDFDHSLLTAAYEEGSRATKRRLLEHARHTGQIDWLSDRSVTGNTRWPTDLNDADWEQAITRLTREARHHDLWQLVQVAPPVWVALILEQLEAASWLPPSQDEQPIFTALSSLACQCRAQPLALHARASLNVPPGPLNALTVAPTGSLLAAGGSDQSIYCWDLPAGDLRHPSISAPAPVVRALAFSPDGSLLAAAAGDHRIRVFRLSDGRLIKTLEGHRALIRALAMHPDGRLLASAGFDGSIRLWRFPYGPDLQTMQPSTNPVAEIFALVTGAAAGGAAYLLSAGADRLVSVWSLPEGRLLRQMAGHEDTITNLATSPGSDLVASAGRDGLVRVWNYTSGGLLRALQPADAPLTALCMHPTDHVLIGAVIYAQPNPRAEIVMWNLSTGRIIDRASHAQGEQSPSQPITALVASPSGDELYSCDSAGRLLIWDLRAFLTARLAGETSRPGAGKLLQARLQQPTLTAPERLWLSFSAELARFRQRFDIELADFDSNALKTISVGEFDIEIS